MSAGDDPGGCQNPQTAISISKKLTNLLAVYILRQRSKSILHPKQENRKSRTLKKSNLSKQEHKVLLLMNDGLSNNEIARQLFISEIMVKTHVSNVLSKLKAKRRTEALKIGRDLNII